MAGQSFQNGQTLERFFEPLYVSGQEIPGTEVRAPWTSYYAKLVNAPIAITNYGGVWFEMAMQN